MKSVLKDRKKLLLIFGIVLVFVFSLTIAYAALSAVLTIRGNANVKAANWNIYLSNPRVTRGSATTDLPIIKSNSTLEFKTTLNMPGDFYEFTVDVVNDGDLDAMIENVVKNPDLSVEQSKYLKYEVSYANGESIENKQILYKDTSMPIKVRLEYRKDLNNSDLPNSQVVLDLSLTLEYVQSDGSGSSVVDNGVRNLTKVVSGDLNTSGSEVLVAGEPFYVLSNDGVNVTLFAKYNLNVGYTVSYFDMMNTYRKTLITNPTCLQDSNMIGSYWDAAGMPTNFPWNGVLRFSYTDYWLNNVSSYPAYVYNSNSDLYPYVESYKEYLIENGVNVSEARLMSQEDFKSIGYDATLRDYFPSSTPKWLYSTSYWTGVARDKGYIVTIYSDGYVGEFANSYAELIGDASGIRPVVVVSLTDFS